MVKILKYDNPDHKTKLKTRYIQVKVKNNKSGLEHEVFDEQAINKQTLGRWIQVSRVPSLPHCVNPFSVVTGKKLRLVLDLTHVNPYLVKPKFKYDNLRCLSELFEQNFWFFTYDLESGYHHADICVFHREVLGFSWVVNSHFQRSAFWPQYDMFCHTKLIRIFIRRWRSFGHRCLAYLDDGISGHKTKDLAIQAKDLAIQAKDLAIQAKDLAIQAKDLAIQAKDLAIQASDAQN